MSVDHVNGCCWIHGHLTEAELMADECARCEEAANRPDADDEGDDWRDSDYDDDPPLYRDGELAGMDEEKLRNEWHRQCRIHDNGVDHLPMGHPTIENAAARLTWVEKEAERRGYPEHKWLRDDEPANGEDDMTKSEQWPDPQPIDSAPKKGDFLAFFPICELDDEGALSERIVGGHWFTTCKESNGAIAEPDCLNAIGGWAGDNEEYGDPTHWVPLPTAPVEIVTRSDERQDHGDS